MATHVGTNAAMSVGGGRAIPVRSWSLGTTAGAASDREDALTHAAYASRMTSGTVTPTGFYDASGTPPMSEREWLTGCDVWAMWAWLKKNVRLTDRKCIDIARAVTNRMAGELEAAGSRNRGTFAWVAARDAGRPLPFDGVLPREMVDSLCTIPGVDGSRQAAVVADVLRLVFGNPSRPVAFLPAWRTPDVMAVARGLDGDRFDPAGLPVLADALEEAGCDEAAVLNHLRGMRQTCPKGCGCKADVIESEAFGGAVIALVPPCACPPKPGELRWKPDPAPVRCRGDWALELVLGRA